MNCYKGVLCNPSRRSFLMYAGMSTSLLLLGAVDGGDLLWASTETAYYQSNGAKLTAAFEETLKAARSYLNPAYGDEMAREICRGARDEFVRLLPDIPYIGGDKHPGTKWMLLTAHWIAFLGPMRDKGYPTHSAAQMMYDLYVDYLETLPKENLQKKGHALFSQKYMDIMKSWAEKSKGQQVDWVADFVPGDGRTFDWGIDYHYCPCLEYFKTQGVADMAPYFCLVDFPEHQLMGTGLVRTKTLAQGDDLCNFRYKKGRIVIQDWSSEVSKFKKE